MTLREELHAWLAELPLWQQDLARRLTTATELDDERLDGVLATIRAAYGASLEGEQTPLAEPLALEDLSGATDMESARLVRIGSLRNVGMVASDQQLEFAPDGLTVVYGPNGVGKSTYVAALKRVCRTVDRESSIRPNVFDTPSGERSTAIVEFTRRGQHHAQQVDLESATDLGLDGISIFDAKCAELYLNSRNSVAYVPSSLVVLARLAGTQDVLRHRIDLEIGTLERSRPDFSALPDDSTARAKASSLTEDSDLDEIRSFTDLTEEDRVRLAALRAALAAAEARNARTDAQAARDEAVRARANFTALEELAARVSDAEVVRIRREGTELSELRRAVDDAAAALATSGTAGVGGPAWLAMWQAARTFVEESGQRFPPETGDVCPLCVQPIDSSAAERVGHFERHVQSALQTQARLAQERLTLSLERINPARINTLGLVFPESVDAQWASLATDVSGLREAVTKRMHALANDPLDEKLDPLPATAAPPGVEDWAASREQHAAILDAAADPAGERELRGELDELVGRSALAERLDEVSDWVSIMKRLGALRAARVALATNRITSKQRELSSRVVTESLATALVEELEHLGAAHLPVDVEPHTAVGETQLEIRLAGAHGAPRIAEILSEGEQRAVSLAFFFAETRLAEHEGGIVVDDPVSSLDDERRKYIAQRVAREATKRQVIVLTHDLPFMFDVLDQAQKADLEPKLQGIWRLGGSVGRVDAKLPFTAMRFRERLADLTTRAEHWDRQPDPRDADEAWHRICAFYGDMRTTWECGVEERLFQGVVQRFQRDVKTRELEHVKVTPELIAAIDDGMTRCSFFVHDAPPGTRTALPGRVQLAADLDRLQTFRRETARGSSGS